MGQHVRWGINGSVQPWCINYHTPGEPINFWQL
jgi:hypothetical protein